MKLTNKKIPNDVSLFPPPTTWMSWVGGTVAERDSDGKYKLVDLPNGGKTYNYIPDPDGGKVRYHFDYHDTRKSLMWIGRKTKYRPPEESGTFYADWAVYEWVDGAWELRGEGRRGESRDDNPFFNVKFTPEQRMHPFDKAVENQAIESILRAVAS